MTITEHLEFSVVSAPLAQIDRRALSQAWYSALYGHANGTPQAGKIRTPKSQPQVSHECKPPRERDRAIASPERSRTLRGLGSSPLRAGAAEIDRRASRSSLARRIEQRFLRPGAPPKLATFQLEGDRGRVQVLLKTSAGQMQLVAICPPDARSAVAAALAQARYALAVRGISVRSEVREEAA